MKHRVLRTYHRPSTSPSEKVEWLLRNAKEWEGFPSLYDLPNTEMYERMQRLAKRAIEEGVYSKSTYLGDVISSLKKHIVSARALRRSERVAGALLADSPARSEGGA